MNPDFATKTANTIRQPSTANLMIDSDDRNEVIYPSPFDFQIYRPTSIMNGFFTRIGTTEVVMDWFEPNISEKLGNSSLQIDLSGIAPNTYSGILTFDISGNYTEAQLINLVVDLLNANQILTGMTFVIVQNPTAFGSTDGWIRFGNTPLRQQAGFWNNEGYMPYFKSIIPKNPDLRPYKYVDIVSDNLTYCQKLKDNSTADIQRDVLCRWYFDFDEQNILDSLGFPVFMGSIPFCIRRLYNPPKQINWDSSMPIGNINFSVYDPQGNIVYYDASYSKSSWRMTLQLSEN